MNLDSPQHAYHRDSVYYSHWNFPASVCNKWNLKPTKHSSKRSTQLCNRMMRGLGTNA